MEGGFCLFRELVWTPSALLCNDSELLYSHVLLFQIPSPYGFFFSLHDTSWVGRVYSNIPLSQRKELVSER